MGVNNDIDTEIGRVFGAPWSTLNGRVVPTAEDIALSNGAVRLDVVLLDADFYHTAVLTP